MERLIFIIVCLGAFAFFFKNIFRLVATICLGRAENRFDNLWSRCGSMFSYGFAQLRVVQKKFGYNHFFLFWGFMTLVLVNFEFLLNGIFPEFSLDFMGVLYVLLKFAADIMSLVVLGCVVLALARRLFFRPYFIDQTGDAFFILGMVGALMIAYFGQHACEVAAGTREGSVAMPVTWFLANFFSSERFWFFNIITTTSTTSATRSTNNTNRSTCGSTCGSTS